MVGDATYRSFVAALWALVGAARDRNGCHVEAAGHAALQALAAARGEESYVMLHEQDGAIHVNGRQLQLGVDVFTAAQGLAALLRGRGLGEVLFDAAVDQDALVAWARCWAESGDVAEDPEAELGRHGAQGVHASRRQVDAEPLLTLRRRSAKADPSDSQLRSVFLQHRLIAAIPAGGLVPPTLAKVVVQAVVDRLLDIQGGLEPLMLLQRDEALLRRSLHAAVLAVVVARAAGWDERQLADIGAAALLHDVGTILDPVRPVAAGFAWLLERGGDDFWLRCAVVARCWREDHGASVEQVEGGRCAAAAFVRLAVEMERVHGAGADLAAIEPVLRCAAAAGAFPGEFVDVAIAACASMAG